MTLIRSPIIVLLGHVDHGKTSLADAIRGSRVAAKEAGGITQMIGASYISKSTIDSLSSSLPEKMRASLKIPGLLFIDTPGHEAFTNLRARGGSIADMAILVVDAMQGFQPQTIESIRILKQYKTPFVVAANKIDLVNGWKNQDTHSFMQSLGKQREEIRTAVDNKIYELVGKISEYGIDSERFDRITDFKTQVAVIPISAKTKEGLSELLVIISGLSQRFLEESLKTEERGAGKGSILEVKEEKGLGTTLDVILYDGVLRKNDDIVFLTNNGTEVTKVRGLLEPSPDPKEKYRYVEEVVAAAGVKIFAPNLENAIPGAPFKVAENVENDRKEIEQQFKHIILEHADKGVIVKADSLGSVEALISLLKGAEIPIKQASVGKITRKDIVAAQAMATQERHFGVVLGFNVAILDEAKEESENSGVPILWSNIIYELLDRYKEFVKEQKEKEKVDALAKFSFPGKVLLLPGFVFRISKPAIFGVRITGGKIRKGYRLMNKAGDIVGEIREIQHEKKGIEEANAGMEAALSCEGITYGKNASEREELYVFMTSDEIKKLETITLSTEERLILEEIKNILKKYF
jgi:translation initiation factor 5B